MEVAPRPPVDGPRFVDQSVRSHGSFPVRAKHRARSEQEKLLGVGKELLAAAMEEPWVALASAFEPERDLWLRQWLFCRVATEELVTRVFRSLSRPGGVDCLVRMALVRASLQGLLGNTEELALEWEAAIELRSSAVQNLWNGHLPCRVIEELIDQGLDDVDVLVSVCFVDDWFSLVPKLLEKRRFFCLSQLLKNNIVSLEERHVLLRKLLLKIEDSDLLQRRPFVTNSADLSWSMELSTAQYLETLAALFYERSTLLELDWKKALDIASRKLNASDPGVRRRAFHVFSNVCLGNQGASEQVLDDGKLLQYLMQHLELFSKFSNREKTSDDAQQIRKLKHPLLAVLHATQACSRVFDAAKERSLFDDLVRYLETPRLSHMHAIMLTLATELIARLPDDKARRSKLADIMIRKPFLEPLRDSVLSFCQNSLKFKRDTVKIISLFGDVYVSLRCPSDDLEQAMILLTRDFVALHNRRCVWEEFPHLYCRITGTELSELELGIAFVCVALGMQPGSAALTYAVSQIMRDAEVFGSYSEDDARSVFMYEVQLLRVCFDYVLRCLFERPESTWSVIDTDLDQFEEVIAFVDAQAEYLMAAVARSHHIRQCGNGWPERVDFNERQHVVERKDGQRNVTQLFYLRQENQPLEEAVAELLGNVDDEKKTRMNMWLHVAPYDAACELAYGSEKLLGGSKGVPYDFSSQPAKYFWPGCSYYEAQNHSNFASRRAVNSKARGVVNTNEPQNNKNDNNNNNNNNDEHWRKKSMRKEAKRATKQKQDSRIAKSSRGDSRSYVVEENWGVVVVLEPGLENQDLWYWHVSRELVNITAAELNDLRRSRIRRREGWKSSAVRTREAGEELSWTCSYRVGSAANGKVEPSKENPADRTWFSLVAHCRFGLGPERPVPREADEEDVETLEGLMDFIFGAVASTPHCVRKGDASKVECFQGKLTEAKAHREELNMCCVSHQLAAKTDRAVDYMRQHVVGVILMPGIRLV